jgi:hypothetical protein
MAEGTATANVYGELIAGFIPDIYLKKAGDTASGKIIFDGGIETNIGTATFNGPIIATDDVTIQPSGSLFVDGPSDFAADVSVTGGLFSVDVPATFNSTVVYNDSLTFNDLITCTDQVQLTSTSSLTVAGTSLWDAGASLDVNCTATFNDLITCTDQVQLANTSSLTVSGTSSWDAGASLDVNCIAAFNSSQTTFGASPTLNQTMTGVALITQDINNDKVSSVTADQINLSDQVASVVNQSLTLTSTFLNIDNFSTGAESAVTNDGVYFSNNTAPNAASKLDLLECRIQSSPLTYANMSVVSGVPTISTYFNDGLGTNNQQSNMTYTGFGTQDNLYQTNAAMSNGGFITATCRSTLVTQPMLQLKNTAASTTGVYMEAYKEKPSAGVGGDEIFRLSMQGKNSTNFKEEYGRITCNIRDPSGSGVGADGQLLFAVPVNDAMSTFIDINGNSNRINLLKDVAWGNGSIQNTAYTGFTGGPTTFTNPSITFDTQGKITAVTNGTPVGSLTSIPLISPANVGASNDVIDVVAPIILTAGTYIMLGNIAVRTVSGSGVFDVIYLAIVLDGNIDSQTFVTGNNSYIVSAVPPTVPFTSTGTTQLSMSLTALTSPASNWTYSLISVQSKLFALRIA